MNLASILKSLVLISCPMLVMAQSKDTVSFAVEVRYSSLPDQDDKSPVFKINLKNTGDNNIQVPKKSILSPFEYKSESYINTVIETLAEFQNCDDSLVQAQCNICFFGVAEDDYKRNYITIKPGQKHILESPITCHEFKRGGRYRVQFSIDTRRTGLRGKSQWIYFQVPN